MLFFTVEKVVGSALELSVKRGFYIRQVLIKTYRLKTLFLLFFDFSLTVKAAPHECVIRTGQP